MNYLLCAVHYVDFYLSIYHMETVTLASYKVSVLKWLGPSWCFLVILICILLLNVNVSIITILTADFIAISTSLKYK